MATTNLKMSLARAFWCASSEMRQALRDNAPQPEIDVLTKELQDHALFGVLPRIKQGADDLLAQAHQAVRTGS